MEYISSLVCSSLLSSILCSNAWKKGTKQGQTRRSAFVVNVPPNAQSNILERWPSSFVRASNTYRKHQIRGNHKGETKVFGKLSQNGKRILGVRSRYFYYCSVGLWFCVIYTVARGVPEGDVYLKPSDISLHQADFNPRQTFYNHL